MLISRDGGVYGDDRNDLRVRIPGSFTAIEKRKNCLLISFMFVHTREDSRGRDAKGTVELELERPFCKESYSGNVAREGYRHWPAVIFRDATVLNVKNSE